MSTMFVHNGITFAGQMLIPIYLVRACGLSPSQTGRLLAPLGMGMICTYPFLGGLAERLGIRMLAASGALLALLGTAPFMFFAWQGIATWALILSLFFRGLGLGAIGVPTVSAAFAPVPRRELPMATTALNIVQRLGGPTLTTACATFLAWRLSASALDASISSAFVPAFALLSAFHVLLALLALRLPRRLPDPPDEFLNLSTPE
jgi:MFS family permease